jgi:hypothetical protein
MNTFTQSSGPAIRVRSLSTTYVVHEREQGVGNA